MTRSRSAVVGMALVLVSSCAYGVTPALIKVAYRADLEELSLIALRSAIGAVAVAVVALVIRERRVERGMALRLTALGAVLYAPQMWLYFASLHWLSTSVAVAAVYVYPAIVAALSAFRLRRPPPTAEAVLLGVALVGITIIAVSAGHSRVGLLGLALALAAALGYAVYVVLAAPLTADTPVVGAAAWVLAGAAASTTVAALVTGRLTVPASGLAWSYVLLHGLLVVPVGLVAFYAGLRRLGPTRAALVDTAQPAIAVAVGVAALGETVGLGLGLGIVLVVAAVVAIPFTSGETALATPQDVAASSEARP